MELVLQYHAPAVATVSYKFVSNLQKLKDQSFKWAHVFLLGYFCSLLKYIA